MFFSFRAVVTLFVWVWGNGGRGKRGKGCRVSGVWCGCGVVVVWCGRGGVGVAKKKLKKSTGHRKKTTPPNKKKLNYYYDTATKKLYITQMLYVCNM